jgi:hypothetical protein
MITKDLILDNFNFVDASDRIITKSIIIELVERWKHLLVSRGAKRGDTLALAFIMLDDNHIALLFAAAELGMCLLILDKPVVKETIDKTRAAVFSPIDFVVVDRHAREWRDHNEMINRYCNNVILVEEIDTVTDRFTEIWGTADDNFIGASSSGTTGEPVPAYYTQKKCLIHAERCARIFKYDKDTIVGHSRNMHHVSSMLIVILPSLLSVEKHYYYNIYSDLDGFASFIREKQIDRVFIGSEFVIKAFVRAAKDNNIKFDKTVIGSISGFTVPEDYIEYCNLLNMEIMSHIGAVGVAVAPVINHVTKDSVYKPNWLGKQPDDFYKIELIDNTVRLRSPEDDYQTSYLLEDHVEIIDGEWFHLGRISKNPLEDEIRDALGKDCNIYIDYLVIWDSDPIDIPEKYQHLKVYYLNKELWTTETKVNAYQLRGFLDIQQARRESGLITVEPTIKESAVGIEKYHLTFGRESAIMKE